MFSKIIKFSYFLRTTVIILAFFIFTLATVSFITIGNASAAVPGCYLQTGQNIIQDANCPTGVGNNGGNDFTHCFVADGNSQGGLDYVLTPCSNVDVINAGSSGGTPSTPATSTGDNSQGSNLEVLKTAKNCSAPDLSSSNCEIVSYLVRGINILSAIAGIAIIGSIMIAGYQYMLAGGDPGKVQAARKRIVMAGIALLLFIFMYGLLNFLIPGGVL